MTLPLFNRNQGNIAKARSVQAQTEFNLDAGLAALRAEIEQAAEEFRTAHANAGAVAEEQVKLAREVRDSIEKAFQEGGRPLIELLDAQRSYRETSRLYITGRANYCRSLHRLNSAMGIQRLR